MEENQELKEESRRIFGKREMLWNFQRQIYAKKIKNEIIDEDWLIKILESLENMQQTEEENWDMLNFMDSEVEMELIKESKILNTKIKAKILVQRADRNGLIKSLDEIENEDENGFIQLILMDRITMIERSVIIRIKDIRIIEDDCLKTYDNKSYYPTNIKDIEKILLN